MLYNVLKLFDDISVYQAMDRITVKSRLPYEITRDNDKSTIKIYLAGIAREDIDIEVKEKVLKVSIKGTQVSQLFPLPSTIEVSQIRAKYENGLLSISVYNKEAPLATKIPIE